MTFDDWISTDVDGDRAEGQYRAERDAAEGEREQRWNDFVDTVKAERRQCRWDAVTKRASSAMFLAEAGPGAHWPPSDFERACIDFAETEGWEGVLSAIGRAMLEASAAPRRAKRT